MAAVPETNDLGTSTRTHGAMVAPRAVGGMTPTSTATLSNPPRDALHPSYYHRRGSITTTEEVRMVSPELDGKSLD